MQSIKEDDQSETTSPKPIREDAIPLENSLTLSDEQIVEATFVHDSTSAESAATIPPPSTTFTTTLSPTTPEDYKSQFPLHLQKSPAATTPVARSTDQSAPPPSSPDSQSSSRASLYRYTPKSSPLRPTSASATPTISESLQSSTIPSPRRRPRSSFRTLFQLDNPQVGALLFDRNNLGNRHRKPPAWYLVQLGNHSESPEGVELQPLEKFPDHINLAMEDAAHDEVAPGAPNLQLWNEFWNRWDIQDLHVVAGTSSNDHDELVCGAEFLLQDSIEHAAGIMDGLDPARRYLAMREIRWLRPAPSTVKPDLVVSSDVIGTNTQRSFMLDRCHLVGEVKPDNGIQANFLNQAFKVDKQLRGRIEERYGPTAPSSPQPGWTAVLVAFVGSHFRLYLWQDGVIRPTNSHLYESSRRSVPGPQAHLFRSLATDEGKLLWQGAMMDVVRLSRGQPVADPDMYGLPGVGHTQLQHYPDSSSGSSSGSASSDE